MAGVFTVFNIGTGHTRNEPNNTIARLYNDCVGEKFINDGAGTGGNWASNALGNAQGRSMDPRCREAVDAILRARPTVLNLAGHSRGAVMCHMIANDLAASDDPAAKAIQRINMVVLDPVNMSVHTQRGGELRGGIKLGFYVSIVMENVTKVIFPSMTVKAMDGHFRESMIWLHMPGTHGSGTQPLTSSIGKATLLTMQRCLAEWDTRFGTGLPKSTTMCEAYAGIHVENPVKYDKKGLVEKRLLTDDPKGQSTSRFDPAITQSWQKVGRVKDIVANYERMTKAGRNTVNLRDSPYFFNTFHMACFKTAFPAIFARCEDFRQTDHDQMAIDREILEIETRYPNISTSMKRLGMI